MSQLWIKELLKKIDLTPQNVSLAAAMTQSCPQALTMVGLYRDFHREVFKRVFKS